MSIEKEIKRVTTKSLALLKKNNVKISALTAYDFITAKLLDEAGIDLLLVGDSLSNVFQGNETTLPVTMDEMIYHTKAVAKGVQRAMIVVDMPFMSYQLNVDEAFRNAGRIMKETPAGAVKLEGGERIAETINKITNHGLPVMGHIGLLPQSIHSYGGYSERGKTDEEAQEKMDGWSFFQFALILYNKEGPFEPGTVNLWERYQEWKETGEGQKIQPNSGLVGSPDTIRERLKQFQAVHVDQVILLNQAGKNRHEDICSSLELFANEVMGEFHGYEEEHQAWKRSVLAGETQLEDIDTDQYNIYSLQTPTSEAK